MKRPSKKILQKGAVSFLMVSASFTAWMAHAANIDHGKVKNPSDKNLWCLKPISDAGPPKVKNSAQVRNPVDAFVLAKLEEKGLSLSPEADRVTLIRRVTFDLTGLPPTPEEVSAFVNDRSKSAYDKVVKRLLDSPRYGERWGRHWLDVVHYGDTHGFDRDKRRPWQWPYRDYVIKAFNDDKPYPRFVKEQLAGDVLYPGDKEALIATGFVTAGPWDYESQTVLREGTVEMDKCRSLDRDDMVMQTMGTFASLTVHCARCHYHKFDPIPQEDYYRLQAVFSGVERDNRLVSDPAADKRAAITKKQAELAASLPAGWSSDIAPMQDTKKWVQIDLGKTCPIDEIRIFPAHPIDSDKDGFGFPLRFTVTVSDNKDFGKSDTITDQTLVDFPNPGTATVKFPGNGKSARYVRVNANLLYSKAQDAYLMAFGEIEVQSQGQNVAADAPVTASDSLDASSWNTKFLTDGFDGRGWLRFPLDFDVRKHAVVVVDDYNALSKQLVELPPQQMTYAISPVTARKVMVLKRGDVTKPTEEVEPAGLSCVDAVKVDFPTDPKQEGKRRAALAEWFTDPKNPLTNRSIVNRIWEYHLGRGIAATPNDFGRNGTAPTNPELLDYLASEFAKSGGSMKKLHTLIVTSATYRQSSAANAKASAIDADNILLWRMNRTRLEAEEVRDAVLAVAGKLDLTMGGPGYDLFRFTDDKSPVYDHSDVGKINDPANWRRTVYRFVVRSVPNPFLECLDCADPSINTPVRNNTVTALQSLALFNDPFVIKQSENFAQRLSKAAKSPSGQIEAGYRIAFGRAPTKKEIEALLPLVQKDGLPAFCRVLFNTNEFFFID